MTKNNTKLTHEMYVCSGNTSVFSLMPKGLYRKTKQAPEILAVCECVFTEKECTYPELPDVGDVVYNTFGQKVEIVKISYSSNSNTNQSLSK